MPTIFYHHIIHGAYCLHTAPQLTRRYPPLPPGLTIRTLNIWYGRGFGLAQAIGEVGRDDFDLMILTKKRSRRRRTYTTGWAMT